MWSLFGALSTESLLTALDSQFTYSEPPRNEPDRQNGPVVSSAMEDCNELLELAAQGGIQFVRATEDGRYEVMNGSIMIFVFMFSRVARVSRVSFARPPIGFFSRFFERQFDETWAFDRRL